jgi:amidase
MSVHSDDTVSSWTSDAIEQADDVRRRRRSAEELLEESIRRIEAWDDDVNSVIHRLYEDRRIDFDVDGPFAGVPILVKDYGCQTAGDPYHEGMGVLRSRRWRAQRDSLLAERFRRAGMMILGRTNTPELASSYTTEPAAAGPTRNPWARKRSCGGSSGGSAAAVALGLVAVAHGNDCGGSIRVPSSACGVVGLKPTRGRIPLHPHTEGHWAMLTHEGVITRTVRDTAAVLDWISGGTKSDPYPAPVRVRRLSKDLQRGPRRLRIGIRSRIPVDGGSPDPECIAAVASATKLLEELGHHVFEEEIPVLDNLAVAEANGCIFSVTVARAVDRWSETLGETIEPMELEPRNRLLAEAGRSVTASEYVRAIETLNRYVPDLLRYWSSTLDVLVTPTLPTLPPLLGAQAQEEPEGPYLGRFTIPFNITGQPAVSLPLHWTKSGVPVGVQLVGDMGREDLLVRLAAQLELAAPWGQRRPPPTPARVEAASCE